MPVFLYMVELELDDSSRQREWEAWHAAHVGELLKIPGFIAAARFRQSGATRPSYLAVYVLANADVLTTDAYVTRAGPASASNWHGHLRNWRRNVLSGPTEADRACSAHCIHLVDRHSEHDSPLPPGYVRLVPVALDRSLVERGLGLMHHDPSAGAPAPPCSAGKTFIRLKPLTL